jgi:hypothetical protein
VKTKLTPGERNDVARLIFEALRAQYPDRHFTLVEQRGLESLADRPRLELLADRPKPIVQPT